MKLSTYTQVIHIPTIYRWVVFEIHYCFKNRNPDLIPQQGEAKETEAKRSFITTK